MIQMLLIEDNETDALVLKSRVDHMNLQVNVVEAASLKEAFEAFKNNHFDLVICDLNIKDSSGIATFHEIYERYKEIPIVILSAESDEQFAVDAVRAGAQDYIVKGKIEADYLKRIFLFAIERKKNELQKEDYIKNLQEKFVQIDSLIHKSKASDSVAELERTTELEKKQGALLGLLMQLDKERKSLKEEVMANADNLLLPLILKLKTSATDEKLTKQLELLEKNVHELTAPFGSKITRKSYGLTNKEIEICSMIKKGLSTKEIANYLNSSPLTVEKHRSSIRKKLGLSNKDTKLTHFLKEM